MVYHVAGRKFPKTPATLCVLRGIVHAQELMEASRSPIGWDICRAITEHVLGAVCQDGDGYHHHPAVTDSSTHLGAMGDTSADGQGQRGAPRIPVKLEAYGRPSLVPGLAHPVSIIQRD